LPRQGLRGILTQIGISSHATSSRQARRTARKTRRGTTRRAPRYGPRSARRSRNPSQARVENAVAGADVKPRKIQVRKAAPSGREPRVVARALEPSCGEAVVAGQLPARPTAQGAREAREDHSGEEQLHPPEGGGPVRACSCDSQSESRARAGSARFSKLRYPSAAARSSTPPTW